jgi:excisionase family DNA binding protein
MIQTLTVREVAELLNVTPRTVYHYIEKGQVPARRFGKSWVILEDQLRRVLAEPQPEAQG